MSLFSLIVASVLSFHPQQATTLDSKITFRANACGLVSFTKALSSATGLAMEADPALQRQVVLVNVKDVKLSDLMAKVADVVDCEWVDDKGVQRLQVSAQKRRATEEADVQKRAKEISETLAKFRKLVSDDYSPKQLADYVREQVRKREDNVEPDYINIGATLGPQATRMGAGPMGRVFARALSAIDPVVLARLQFDDRVVYSSQPNAKQLRLAFDISAEKAKWEKDNAAFEQAVKLANLSKEEAEMLGRGPDMEGEPPMTTVVKARLVVSRAEMMGSSMIMADFDLIDKDDEVVRSQQTTLWVGMETFALFAGDTNPTLETKLPAREDSLWHRSFLLGRTWTESGMPKPDLKDPRVGSIVLHPNKSEPLSYYTSDLLVACADRVGKNLVAELGDTSILLGYVRGSDGVGLEKLPARFEATVFDNVSQSPTWLMWRPKRASEDRLAVVDRGALTDLMSQRKTPGQSHLESQALYAWGRKSNVSINMIEMLYGQSISEEASLSLFLNNDEYVHPAIVFIGSLDPVLRASLFRGAKLSYGNLPTTQRKLLDRFVYSVTGSRSLNTFGAIWDTGYKRRAEEDEAMPKNEPTDICPNGVPTGASVELQTMDRPQVYVPGEDPKDEWVPIDVNAIAWALAVQKKPSLLKLGDGEPDDPAPKIPSRFRLGSLRTFRFLLWVAPKAYFAYSSVEPAGVVSQREYGLSELPPEVQKQINDSVKSYLESRPSLEGRGPE